jgi:DNA processing protein
VTDRIALIILNMISGIGPVRVRELISVFGSPSQILSKSKKELSSVPGMGEKLANDLSLWQEKTNHEKEIAFTENAGVQIITQIDPEYPTTLKEIYDPPLCLYVRGKLSQTCGHNIGIVESRRVTNYGRRIAQHLAEAASYAGWTVVSRMAC